MVLHTSRHWAVSNDSECPHHGRHWSANSQLLPSHFKVFHFHLFQFLKSNSVIIIIIIIIIIKMMMLMLLVLLLLVIMLSLLFLNAGGVSTEPIRKKYKLTSKTVLLIALSIITLVPIYGLIGFSDSFGLVMGYEVIFVAMVYGSCTGVYQSFSRSIMASFL